MNILFTTSTLPRWPGDSSLAIVLELAAALKARNHGIRCVVLAPHCPGAKKEEELAGVRIVRYKYFFERWQKLAYGSGIPENIRGDRRLLLLVPFFFLAQVLAIRKIVKKEKIGLIHAHWLIPQGLAAAIYRLALNKNIKIVITAHGVDIYSFRSTAFLALKRFALGQSAAITAVSRPLAAAIGIRPAGKIRVIPNGLDLRAFCPGKKNPALAKKYGLDSFCLLFVGRLVEKKGAIYLVKAMPAILEKFPKTKLLIIGNGREHGRISSYIKTTGLEKNIRLLGALPRPDLPDHYRLADIFIAPSIIAKNSDAESFGLVLIEAMACGAPVIAAAANGGSDVVSEATGWLVPPANSAAIAKTVVRLLSDPARLAGKRQPARRYVEENFRWSKVAGQYIDVFNKIYQQS